MKAIVFAGIIALLGWADPGYAENASREKCTCDAKRGELQDNGAVVENASACWASVDESLEWCRITVETLKGDPRHKSILEELRSAKGDPAALFDYLYTASQGALTIEGDQSSPQFLDARSELPAVIKENADLTSACIDLFFDKGGEFEKDDFGCHISGVTGWLKMSYMVGSYRFVFMLAPDA
ncbi:hypothetical protein [Sinorhizobium medicae]|uniref:hypothetical protein n=1 Tax=Sinorhizobium medicae TaxID=110321 RepID=UPI000C7BAF37|nr:hypothetical protein [Sinorhizobium medicae]PLU02512.1 hypothetical protein BMJ32_12220 [Sinorhizobium medicae]PLU58137.1 hypothetical protein BMJ23_06630 [Sinorhizobium medicae]PLU71956.1 hypothetical protein BMJ21_09130 [Sinorhizobium medicae]